MSDVAVALVVLTLVVGAVDRWAVARNRRPVEYVAELVAHVRGGVTTCG